MDGGNLMSELHNDVLDLVGNTPIVKLNRIVEEDMADVYVKLEYFNPALSVKDRIAKFMIEKAEEEGILKPGDTIIEPTSGNTGIGIACVGAIKGYKVVIVMPESMSIERRKVIQAYGAQLILTPADEGLPGSIAKASELANTNGWYMPQQFENPANVQAHIQTGQEIVDAFGFEDLDAFIAGVGTGGTITGVSIELKRVYPDINIYAVESANSHVLSGGTMGPHAIQGISPGLVPPILDQTCYTQTIQVTDDEALETARKAARTEGLMVGISAGAAIFSALKVAKELGPGKSVLALVPDNGERYVSTALFEE